MSGDATNRCPVGLIHSSGYARRNVTGLDQQSIASRTVLSFGGFRLHSEPVALYRQGKPVSLQGQPLRLLQLLANHRGELVTHREIQKHLWRGHVVNFAAGIQVCVTQIRKALDDDVESPRYIETVARHGYRFIARVESDDDRSSDPVPADESHSDSSCPAVAAAAKENRITQDSRLTTVRGDILQWRFPEIRHPLFLLLLIAVFGVLSSANYKTSITQRTSPEIRPAGTSVSELYEKARHLSSYEQKDRSILAQNLLQRALLLDPEHGPSHALLADLYTRFGQLYFGGAEIEDPHLIERHLTLAEQFGAAQSDLLVTRGRVALYQERQVGLAQDMFQRAIAANARNPWAWRLMGQTLYVQGQFDAALVANAKAEKLSADPNGVLWDRLLIYYLAERYTELFALYDKLKDLQQTGAITIGVAKIMVGRHTEAFDFIVNALRSRGIFIADEGGALQLVRSGRLSDAYAWLLSEIAKNDSPPIGDKALAIFQIMSGDPEAAAKRLQSYAQKFQDKATGTNIDCLCALTLPLDPFFRHYSTSRSVRSAVEKIELAAIDATARGDTPRVKRSLVP